MMRRFFAPALFVSLGLVLMFGFLLLRRDPEKTGEDTYKEELSEVLPGEELPLISVVLDDFGYNTRNLESLSKLDVPLTLAVLPGLAYSERVSVFALNNGMEVILHLPMEPEVGGSLEKDTIMTSMDHNRIDALITLHLSSVPGAVGVSNHMGSSATADREVMKTVISRLKEEGLFFLDSLTTPRSVAAEIAAEKNVPYVRRDVFLDNHSDIAYIMAQMDKAVGIALEKGSAVVIGHDRTKTIESLFFVIPEAERKGVKFVALSELINGIGRNETHRGLEKP